MESVKRLFAFIPDGQGGHKIEFFKSNPNKSILQLVEENFSLSDEQYQVLVHGDIEPLMEEVFHLFKVNLYVGDTGHIEKFDDIVYYMDEINKTTNYEDYTQYHIMNGDYQDISMSYNNGRKFVTKLEYLHGE